MSVTLLLKSGANASLKDDEGKTALMLAKENEAAKAIAALQQSTH